MQSKVRTPGSFSRLTFAGWMVFTFMLTAHVSSSAQSVQRQCVASGGITGKVDGVYLGQTVGQCYSTAGTSSLHPGFQQSLLFRQALSTDFGIPPLTVYPNPASCFFTIASTEELKEVLIQVVDLNGRIIFSQKFSGLTPCQIDCRDWSDGLYAVNITDSSFHARTAKLIITK